MNELPNDGDFLTLLEQENLLASGCSELGALAYAASLFAEYLGEEPTKIELYLSSNIIKNVQSAKIPYSNGMVGGDGNAFFIGLASKNSAKGLNAFANLSGADWQKVSDLKKKIDFTCLPKINVPGFYIEVNGCGSSKNVNLIMKYTHTQVYSIMVDGKVIEEHKELDIVFSQKDEVPAFLNYNSIYNFALNVDLAKVKTLLEKMIEHAKAISAEGLKNAYGLELGRQMQKAMQAGTFSTDVKNKMLIDLASAVDARMSGAPYSVVISGGSGNLGLNVTLPLIAFARESKVEHDKLLQAILLSDLLNIYFKIKVGRLSSSCGVSFASSAVAAALVYLQGGTQKQSEQAIITNLATNFGVICDGAKPSCSSKSVMCQSMAYDCANLALAGLVLHEGDGIVKDNLEDFLDDVAVLVKQGVNKMDELILKGMMTGCHT